MVNIIEKWYYDEREFYSYLVFDGSKDLFDLTVRTLKENGVFVYHKGKSYQPASDGKIYDWFVRLKKEESPLGKVGFILKSKNLVLPPFPEKNKRDEIIEVLNKETDPLGQIEYQARVKYENLKKDFLTLTSKYESLLKENEIYKQRNESSQNKLAEDEDIKWDRVRLPFLQAEISKNKKIIENYKTEIENLVIYYNKTFDEFFEEYKNNIENIENEKACLLGEIEQLKNTLKNVNADPIVNAEQRKFNRRLNYDILSIVFRTFMPNKKLINEKQVFEYFGENLNVEDFADRYRNFDTKWKGTKVECADDWWEEHLSYEWRLYYKKINQQWYLYVGLKKDQKKDIEYLRKYKE